MVSKASERALWLTATASPASLRAKLKHFRRGTTEHALLRAAQLQCEGDVKSAVAVLASARSQASDLDCVVIDELLAPLLISRADYVRVTELLKLESPDERFRPGRLALEAVRAAVVADNDLAEQLRQEARRILDDEVGPLLRASTFQRCGLSAYYAGDYAEAQDCALEAGNLYESISAHRVAATAHSLLYALSYSVTNDFEAASEHAIAWEAAARRCGNGAYEHAAIVARYELAAESADEVSTADLRAKLRSRRLPPQFQERFPQIIADVLPYGWRADFRAVKANIVLAQTANSLLTTERAVTYALRAVAEAACGEDAEARKHARRAVALTAHLSRRRLSPYEVRYLMQSRALAAAACVFVGDTVRGRRLSWSRNSSMAILPETSRSYSMVATGSTVSGRFAEQQGCCRRREDRLSAMNTRISGSPKRNSPYFGSWTTACPRHKSLTRRDDRYTRSAFTSRPSSRSSV